LALLGTARRGKGLLVGVVIFGDFFGDGGCSGVVGGIPPLFALPYDDDDASSFLLFLEPPCSSCQFLEEDDECRCADGGRDLRTRPLASSGWSSSEDKETASWT
jgi:hypothetical protein